MVGCASGDCPEPLVWFPVDLREDEDSLLHVAGATTGDKEEIPGVADQPGGEDAPMIGWKIGPEGTDVCGVPVERRGDGFTRSPITGSPEIKGASEFGQCVPPPVSASVMTVP